MSCTPTDGGQEFLPGELSMPYNSTCAQTLRTYEASCHCNWDSRLDCVDHSCSFRSGPPRLGRLDSFFDPDSNMLWLQFPAHLGRRPGRFSPTSIVLSLMRIAQHNLALRYPLHHPIHDKEIR